MKFLSKKKDTEKIERVAQQSRNFEVSLADMARKSERRAWWVAGGSLVVSILLVLGYIGLVPLKEKVPYLVMADPYTGTSTVSRLSNDFQNDTITKNEAINKSNVARFVIARESYDWDLISRQDWNIVNAMGSGDVLAEYRKLFEPTNPHNPDAIYGRKMSVRIKIKTISLKSLPTGKDGQVLLSADVRFDRIVVDKQAARIANTESYIAYLAYEYKPNLAMQEQYRVENPLGFRVTSYRVDPEGGGGSSVSTAVLGDLGNIPQAAPAQPQAPVQPQTPAPAAAVQPQQNVVLPSPQPAASATAQTGGSAQ